MVITRGGVVIADTIKFVQQKRKNEGLPLDKRMVIYRITDLIMIIMKN
jgi:hypothetical protein